MGYVCFNCGECERFEANQNYTEYGIERVYMDREGEVQDYGDKDSTDSETGDIQDTECSKCNSTNIQNIDSWEDMEEQLEDVDNDEAREKIVTWFQTEGGQTNAALVKSWKETIEE